MFLSQGTRSLAPVNFSKSWMFLPPWSMCSLMMAQRNSHHQRFQRAGLLYLHCNVTENWTPSMLQQPALEHPWTTNDNSFNAWSTNPRCTPQKPSPRVTQLAMWNRPSRSDVQCGPLVQPRIPQPLQQGLLQSEDSSQTGGVLLILFVGMLGDKPYDFVFQRLLGCLNAKPCLKNRECIQSNDLCKDINKCKRLVLGYSGNSKTNQFSQTIEIDCRLFLIQKSSPHKREWNYPPWTSRTIWKMEWVKTLLSGSEHPKSLSNWTTIGGQWTPREVPCII